MSKDRTLEEIVRPQIGTESGSDRSNVEPRIQAILTAIKQGVLQEIGSVTDLIKFIGDMYKYEPFPATVEKIDFGKVSAGSLIINLRDDHFADFTSLGHLDALASSKLDTSSGQTLDLVARKIVRTDDESGTVKEYMHVELVNPEKDRKDPSYCACNFFIRRIDHDSYEEWDLRDRITAEAYRGQGIAPAMLRFVEAQLAKRASETGKPQIMTANLAQVDVLFWLLKSGFVPATREDAESINRLLNGDDGLVIVSAPGEKDWPQKRQWYIFEKEKYFTPEGSPKPRIWDLSYYPKESFKIHLKKEISQKF